MFPASIRFDAKYRGKNGDVRHVVFVGERVVDYQPVPVEIAVLSVRCSLLEFAQWAKEEVNE
jgi:hypothetical protein